jgi:hypothetical protein
MAKTNAYVDEGVGDSIVFRCDRKRNSGDSRFLGQWSGLSLDLPAPHSGEGRRLSTGMIGWKAPGAYSRAFAPRKTKTAMVLNHNMLIEGVLPSAVLRKLGDEEMNEYRRPFINNEDRQPTLNWPHAFPIA